MMAMHDVEYWINHLELLPHPEGGYYKETYRSPEMIPSTALPDRFEGDRHFSTAIYFMLRSEDRSVFHRIKSDEVWHFYQGSTLLIYVLQQNQLKIYKLGSDIEKGESLQIVIPANCWFGAQVEKLNSFALCGCTVAPGFISMTLKWRSEKIFWLRIQMNEKLFSVLHIRQLPISVFSVLN